MRLLPPRHSGPRSSPPVSSARWHFAVSTSTASTPRTGSRSRRGSARRLLRRSRSRPRASTPASRSGSRRETLRASSSARFLGELNPLGRKGRMMRRRFQGNSFDDESLDSAGRVRLAEAPDRARRPRGARAWWSASATTSRSGTPSAGPSTGRRDRRRVAERDRRRARAGSA